MNTPLLNFDSVRNRKFYYLLFSFITCFFITTSDELHAQGPGSLFVDAGPDVSIPCGSGGCVDLTASFLETFETISNAYNVNSIDYNPPFPFNGLANPLNPDIDDAWSVVDDLPFDFCFFENIETQFQVGSNGVIRFDVDPGDTTNGWSFSEDLPNNTNETLSEANVFSPCHDIDPSVSTTEEIAYEVLGEFPNRVLVVSYFEVPMFSCNDLLATQMMVFYEFSNVVEVYIQDKPTCDSWNSGNAVIGIQNDAGDTAYVPPGRQTSDSPWTTNNEAWQFSPAGAPTYEFEWLDADGNVIGTDPTVNVCPSGNATYTARITYTNCNGDEVILTDEVEVIPDADFSVELGDDRYFCDTPSHEIVAELEGNTSGATYLWSTGETTSSITVTSTDTYTVEVTVAGCTLTDSVTINFLTSPDCTIDPECSFIDFEENFGTGSGRVCDLGTATTTYICNDATQVEDGQYTITNTSNGLNSGWHLDMEDHTPDDVGGRALFVNADFAVGEFYRRTITLNEDTDYAFSAWITTVYDTDTGICGGSSIPSNVIFRIEDPVGALIAETNTGDIPNGPEPDWQEFFIDFNTGSNTDIQLVLINNAPGGCGNDLAIDDITLTLENTPPQIVEPDDIMICEEDSGNATFDLTSVIDTVLDGQDPAMFNVSFHVTSLEADAGVNAIATPDAYVNTASPETIYVRVEDFDEPTCFSVVDFDLILDLILDFQIDLQSDYDLCSSDGFPTLDATPQNPDVDLSIVTYEWTDGGGTVVSTDATYTPSAAGTYTVVVTSLPCSEETLSTTIQVTEIPTLDLGPDQILCDGGIFDIIPDITGNTDGISYAWSTGETSSSITVDATGTYTLEITVGPCVVTDSIDIFISDPITVEVTPDFRTCPEEAQTISATASDAEATYQWYLNGDILTGETASTLTFTIPAGTMGTQFYSVIATKGECTGENEVAVTLYDVDNCVISQGISPNGSPGMNDELDLEFLSDRTGGITKLQIFNRLGTLVFEKSNYINEWVGQDTDGNELPTGTYFYVIDFLNADDVYGPQATGWIYLNKER
ncbi:gliding motility-associated C-terminal domain-containing protein [Aureisphaera galaxeae]|uniref:gliding motility-associated C-terminal domain-containing protein n=1 Tax=Aureisphaera galaxeae TaxID=1538023 RepID=UPI0023503516|nr:gliding motility-associated C-terminal domain-containing protein [Aureisphaera galaxeae]MDC8002598.1 gliding motility-associated C-terminal domain-containing protein [Aureisphaera galaxeae]